jgi:hypothetical protein
MEVTTDGVLATILDLLTTYTHNFETTSNYIAIANLRTTQITTAHAKSFLDCCLFNSRSSVTASNSGDSSDSAQVLSE